MPTHSTPTASVKKNTALRLTVMRDGKEKELEYEIF